VNLVHARVEPEKISRTRQLARSLVAPTRPKVPDGSGRSSSIGRATLVVPVFSTITTTATPPSQVVRDFATRTRTPSFDVPGGGSTMAMPELAPITAPHPFISGSRMEAGAKRDVKEITMKITIPSQRFTIASSRLKTLSITIVLA